jgi:hypothetical protein
MITAEGFVQHLFAAFYWEVKNTPMPSLTVLLDGSSEEV